MGLGLFHCLSYSHWPKNERFKLKHYDLVCKHLLTKISRTHSKLCNRPSASTDHGATDEIDDAVVATGGEHGGAESDHNNRHHHHAQAPAPTCQDVAAGGTCDEARVMCTCGLERNEHVMWNTCRHTRRGTSVDTRDVEQDTQGRCTIRGDGQDAQQGVGRAVVVCRCLCWLSWWWCAAVSATACDAPLRRIRRAGSCLPDVQAHALPTYRLRHCRRCYPFDGSG